MVLYVVLLYRIIARTILRLISSVKSTPPGLSVDQTGSMLGAGSRWYCVRKVVI